MDSKVTLKPALQIGFTGHRRLANETHARKRIREVLTDWKKKWGGAISGVSSLAAGSDLLFAETCFELKIPLSVLLPLPPEDFKQDFDAATWLRVESALERAACHEVIDGGLPRPECYYECGIATLHQAGLLLTLWDGQPASGKGGTGDIVDQSRELGAPLVWIHSETGAVTEANLHKLHSDDEELAALNNLPEESVAADASPRALAVAWLEKLDRNALKIAPQLRKIVAVPIICAGLGSLLAAAADVFKEHKVLSCVVLLLSAALGLAAFFAPRILRSKQRQQRRAMIRAAAEITRSFLALWDAPIPYVIMDRAELLEHHGMVEALNHLKLAHGFRSRAEGLEQFKADYLKNRIQHQADYFSAQVLPAARVMTRSKWITRVVIFFGVFGNLFLVACSAFQWGETGHWKSEFGLAVAISFQVAAVTGAIVVINDYGRRQQRYVEMRDLILSYAGQLRGAQSWTSVLRVVTRIERALLAEVMEWRTLFKNQNLGK
jgi:hypothetical protein